LLLETQLAKISDRELSGLGKNIVLNSSCVLLISQLRHGGAIASHSFLKFFHRQLTTTVIIFAFQLSFFGRSVKHMLNLDTPEITP